MAVHEPGSGNGACIWIGSSYSKQITINSVNKRIPDESSFTYPLSRPNWYFNTSEAGYRKFIIFWQRMGSYFRSEDDGRFLHNQDYSCGRFWLGIAGFPLPPDFYHPKSFWRDWGHLVHWEPEITQSTHFVSDREALEKFSSKLPSRERVFPFVAGIIEKTGYPTDLQKLSRLIIENFHISLRGVPKEALYAHFPFLDPVISEVSRASLCKAK